MSETCPCGDEPMSQEEIAARLDAAFGSERDQLKRELIERGGQP